MDAETSLLLGMSITASTVLPAMIAAFYLPQLGFPSVTTAISTGFATSVLYFVLATTGIDFIPANGDEVLLPLPGMPEGLPGPLGGLVGATAAAVILVASLLISAFYDQAERSDTGDETENAAGGLDAA